MDYNYFETNSGSSKVFRFIKERGPNKFITIDDLLLEVNVSYTSIRSIVVSFCERKILSRVARGVYFYHGDEIYMPEIKSIIDFACSKWKVKYFAVGDYARFLMGLEKTMPHKITCHINGKLKTMNLWDKTSIKFIPSQKRLFERFSSTELMMLISYIQTEENHKIKQKERDILSLYFKKLDLSSQDKKCIPYDVKNILGLL